MWFTFPDGCEELSVQQQTFRTEHTDKAGLRFFRAPDHFAAQILDLPGFKRANQPEGAPPDIPSGGSPREVAVDDLSKELTAAKAAEERMRVAAAEAIAARDTALGQVAELEARVKELEEAIASGDTSDGKPKK